MSYTKGFKSRMVTRLSGPGKISVAVLSHEVGVAQSTLFRWLSQAKAAGAARNTTARRERTHMEPKNSDEQPRRRPQDWKAEERLQLVFEAANLSDEELGAFLRSKGLHEAHLASWRQAAMEALAPSKKRKSKKNTAEVKRIRLLERELNRKDKALAEVTALLALSKKYSALWGDEDDGTPGPSAK